MADITLAIQANRLIGNKGFGDWNATIIILNANHFECKKHDF